MSYVICVWDDRDSFAVVLPSGRRSPRRFVSWDAANNYARSKRSA
jgi:hypothetical protein